MSWYLKVFLLGFVLVALGIWPQERETNVILGLVEHEKLAPTRWADGSTTITNEARLDLFRGFLEKVSGGFYIGVGSTQNFTLAAWAKSDVLYLVDFTKIVVQSNRLHLLFIEASATKEAYLRLWQKKGRRDALRILKKQFRGDVYKSFKRAFHISAGYFRYHSKKMRKIAKKFAYELFYTSEEMYQYIRRLVLKGQVHAVQCDLRGPTAIRSIGQIARKLGSKVQVLYFSNAEDYPALYTYSTSFKNNFLALPFATDGLVLRTTSIKRDKRPWAPGSHLLTTRGFHYVVQSMPSFHGWLEKKKVTSGAMYNQGGKTFKSKGLTTIFTPEGTRVK